jgi:hypothetical protein
MKRSGMSEDGDLSYVPTREECDAKLTSLINDKISREEIAEWAARWVRMDHPNMQNGAVWKMLRRASGADLISIDRPYLYGKEDFLAWRAELRKES